jgi:hypothetical protein
MLTKDHYNDPHFFDHLFFLKQKVSKKKMKVSSFNYQGHLDLKKVEENLAKELQRKKI